MFRRQASLNVVLLEVVELSDDSKARKKQRSKKKQQQGRKKVADNGGTSGSLGGKHFSLKELPCLAVGIALTFPFSIARKLFELLRSQSFAPLSRFENKSRILVIKA